MKRAIRLHEVQVSLAQALSSAALTAREIVALFNCSKPTAYSRIKGLSAVGYVVARTSKREGKRGPLAQAFQVVGGPPLVPA